nr:hypothetical protein [candidate division Zixibacteria bacterium]NIX54722.1 hypothetical protein [candidate division Zixibacteria bacterium]
MNPEENTNITPSAENFPFPREWIQSNPKKVEGILSRMSLPDQVRCIQLLRGRDQQSLLQLSHQAAKVVQLLPEEDIYFMVKEIGEEDALPVLSIISTPQLQYIFDMEWWRGDKFLPDKAVDWLRWMQKANMEQLVYWVLTEDLDQKIMVLQSLVKVFKRDEMTDSYEGVEGLLHFSPDGVYDIYFKVADIEPVLKDVFQRLYADHQKMFYTLMEGAIWYPVTPTLEQAYRWWSSRVEARGYLPLEEAQGVYSLLSVDALKLDAPAPDAFIEPQSPYAVAPTHPLVDTDPSTFFGQCLAMMKNPERVNAICWELMYLANKVMVADGQDGTNMDTRHEVMRKVLGYVNIGLELGAGGD